MSNNEEYDEDRMKALIEFYERMVSGLKEWAKDNSLNTIPNNQNAPALFRLHQVARLLLPEVRLELKVDELVVQQTNDANAVLKGAGVAFELRPEEFLALASIMRTHDYKPLAPYNPHPAVGQNGEPIIW